MAYMLPYLLLFAIPAIGHLAFSLGGAWVLVPAAFTWAAIPALDHVFGENRQNPGAFASSRWLRALPFGYGVLHMLALASGLGQIVHTGTLAEKLGLTVSLGIGGGLAIMVAHELMHRPTRAEQRLAELLMASTTYTHFCIEHVWGHHKRVATPDDPASARRGESLYAFLPRTLWGSFRSAWELERARTRNRPWWRNRMYGYAAFQVLVLAGIGAWLGPWGVVVFLAQSAIAVLMLETINYIEHYGLARAEVAPGRYERVRPVHSWNASHRVSNWMILNLARHSDHHAFPGRTYAELRHHEDVPQLPNGYAGMMVLATIPPLWFRVMDPRLEAWEARAAA